MNKLQLSHLLPKMLDIRAGLVDNGLLTGNLPTCPENKIESNETMIQQRLKHTTVLFRRDRVDGRWRLAERLMV